MATAKQVQELVAAVQSLNLEVRNLNQEVQNLKVENNVLRQLVANREPHSSDLPSMPLSSVKFDGTPKLLQEFIKACNVHFAFRPTTFSTDLSKVGFVISNMTGNALAWANPLVTTDDPVLRDWEAFLTKLKRPLKGQKLNSWLVKNCWRFTEDRWASCPILQSLSN
ncbi:protein LDOC1-like [Ambystoma mexicanum]|uniref:protein LDOC1-like n=1 Tax=Ambystoma mexicanum TaxID=8296 RepID=UPI0037E7321E